MTDLNVARLQANLDDVRRRIDSAARRAGRSADDVRLVVVTKYVPIDVISALVSLGATDIGENRPVEGLKRIGPLEGVRRHMVGHVQTNKLKKVLQWADVLHSLDRRALLEALAGAKPSFQVFVQTNVSGEDSKGGFAPGEVRSVVEEARRSMTVEGLMTMAPAEGDPRPWFRRLRELAEGAGVAGLSMGMTRDFEAAVEEGATFVRIGTAIFDGVTV